MGEPDNDGEQYDEQEIAEWNAWAGTEPGIRHRLKMRTAQMARLAELGAPAVILANQVRMIAETEAALRGVPAEDVIRGLVRVIRNRKPHAWLAPVYLLGRAVRSGRRRLRGQGRRAVPGVP